MTNEEYEQKLERVGFLMDKNCLSYLEGTELEDLAIEIEEYESELYD